MKITQQELERVRRELEILQSRNLSVSFDYSDVSNKETPTKESRSSSNNNTSDIIRKKDDKITSLQNDITSLLKQLAVKESENTNHIHSIRMLQERDTNNSSQVIIPYTEYFPSCENIFLFPA